MSFNNKSDMPNENKEVGTYPCIECQLLLHLDEPMNDDKAASGYYNDMGINFNSTGDKCNCENTQHWCNVCSSCFDCIEN